MGILLGQYKIEYPKNNLSYHSYDNLINFCGCFNENPNFLSDNIHIEKFLAKSFTEKQLDIYNAKKTYNQNYVKD